MKAVLDLKFLENYEILEFEEIIKKIREFLGFLVKNDQGLLPEFSESVQQCGSNHLRKFGFRNVQNQQK